MSAKRSELFATRMGEELKKRDDGKVKAMGKSRIAGRMPFPCLPTNSAGVSLPLYAFLGFQAVCAPLDTALPIMQQHVLRSIWGTGRKSGKGRPFLDQVASLHEKSLQSVECKYAEVSVGERFEVP